MRPKIIHSPEKENNRPGSCDVRIRGTQGNRKDHVQSGRLKILLFAAALIGLDGLGPQARGERPNIVYILADDLGYGDVRCLNENSKIPTPNIDRLASQGMTFTDAHSGSAVCTPTTEGVYCAQRPNVAVE
ncbi:MAG: sulfatase-like hydrolase/transferase [Opitutaceae bacterium]|nr:sulfatase-like hydrolase/transferase [Opitutaceae bacterium]